MAWMALTILAGMIMGNAPSSAQATVAPIPGRDGHSCETRTGTVSHLIPWPCAAATARAPGRWPAVRILHTLTNNSRWRAVHWARAAGSAIIRRYRARFWAVSVVRTAGSARHSAALRMQPSVSDLGRTTSPSWMSGSEMAVSPRAVRTERGRDADHPPGGPRVNQDGIPDCSGVMMIVMPSVDCKPFFGFDCCGASDPAAD